MSNEEMRRSWLVQRLRKPYPGEGPSSGPFAFGGGLKNGGLREDALKLFKDLFRFDYMGAAEFEFGEVPKTFERIAKAADRPGLVAGSFEVQIADVEPHWDALPKGARWDDRSKWPKTDEVRTVWYLCQQGQGQEVEKRIRGWATSRYNHDLKVPTNLAGSLRPHHDWEKDGTQSVGWLELNNAFMFFVDEEMWRGTCKLFGLRE